MFKTLKKIWRYLEFFFGVVLPGIVFMVMFVSFCLQIFSRYVLNNQFSWTYEYTVIGFLWSVAFGAIWASKQREHVSFSLLYDRFGPKGRAIINLVGSLMIFAAFVLMLPATYEYIEFIGLKKTAVLKVPFSALYAPFLVFIVFSTIYLIRDCVRDIITLRTPTAVLLEREARQRAETERRAAQEEAERIAQMSNLFGDSDAEPDEKGERSE